ncbi:MAG: hypothetical protein ACRDI2_05350 [Chloroflexota bacterium]
MVNRWVGAAAGLVGGQVAGRALSVFLSSKAGERLLEQIDQEPLTPLEHRVLAQKWSGTIAKALSAAAAALVITRDGTVSDDHVIRTSTMAGRNVDWVQVVQRAGEIMLAVGAIFKVVGEYLEDRQKTAGETERRASRRLT